MFSIHKAITDSSLTRKADDEPAHMDHEAIWESTMASHNDNTSRVTFLQDNTDNTYLLTNVSSVHIQNEVGATSMTSPIDKYCLPLACIFGLVGNTLAMIVFLRKELRTTSCNLYLAARSASDNGFLFILFLIWISNILDLCIMSINIICHLIIFFTYIFGAVSVWLVVMVTIENYIRICRPFKVTQFCTTMKAKFLIGAFCVGVLTLYHPPLWILSANCALYPEFAKVMQALVLTDSLLTLMVPAFLISGFTITITYSYIKYLPIKRKRKPYRRRCRRPNNSPQSKVTKMLFALTVIFFALNFPSHVIRAKMLINTYMMGSEKSPELDGIFHNVFQLMYYLSFSINILIYLTFGEKFRIYFINLFCKKETIVVRKNTGCVPSSIVNDQSVSTKKILNII